VQLQYLDVLGPKDIETAFREASKGRADAVLMLAASVLSSQRTQIADLAVKSRLPAIYTQTEFVEAGGLMSYGTNVVDLYRRGYLCGQDSEGRQARRSACRAASEVRPNYQSQDRQADRPDDSAVGAVPGGQGDQVKF